MKKPRKSEDAAEQGLFGAALPVGPSAPGPAKNPKGLLAFSYSKMSLYEECPLKYKFKYVDKIKEEPKYYFAFGSSIHSALEFLYAVKAPPFPGLDELLEAFKKDWGLKSYLEKGYKDPLREEEDYRKGLEMLKNYYRRHDGKFKLPFLLEYSTDVEVDGLLVRIIADKIEYLGNGEIVLVDYKTGKDVKRQPSQLYMYQKICELDPRLRERVRSVYGDQAPVRIGGMLYYHVPTLKEYHFDRAGDAEIGVFWERVLEAAGKIRALKYEPTPGERQCLWCDYKKLCPHYYGGRGLGAPPPPAAADPVEELVDRYGHLQEKMAALSAQIDEVKARIISLAEGASGAAGKTYALEIRRAEKWEFGNREAVIGVLNEFDLYQKALGLTLKNIVMLMNDPAVPEPAREKLRLHARRSHVFDLHLKKNGGTPS
ncbi:MAG: PD-(D/E)XK nuclease family protein [Elusimicrobiales bacterium]|jgi:putative RecB family exonuclease